jgi:hypothetical protein
MNEQIIPTASLRWRRIDDPDTGKRVLEQLIIINIFDGMVLKDWRQEWREIPEVS